MMRQKFFLMTICCWVMHSLIAQSQQPNEFIVKPIIKKKKMSANDLKEEIGEKIKHMFDNTSQLIKHLGSLHCTLATYQKKPCDGSMAQKVLQESALVNESTGTLQQELSVLQTKCSSIAQKLIENSKPFKKASKNILEKSLHVLTQIQEQLSSSATCIARLSTAKKNNACVQIQSMAKSLQQEIKQIQQARTALNTDECLKNV